MIKIFNKSTRCQCSTKNGNICKVKKVNLYMINNKYYCRIHFNYNFVKFIIIIQKYWRAYYCRRKVNNIYKKLPYDLQQNILWYMKKYDYYINLTKSINKILKKRTNELHRISTLDDRHLIKSLRNTNFYMIYLDDIFLEKIYLNVINNESFIFSTCILYNKYRYWDNIKYDTLENTLDNILALIEVIIDSKIYSNYHNNTIILNNLENILYKSIWTSEC